MARALLTSHSYFFFLILMIISSYATLGVLGKKYEYVKHVNPHETKMLEKKITHFRVYWQDIVNGTSGTSVVVINQVTNSSTAFGATNIFDDPLTVKQNLSSKMVGRAEGLYAWTGTQQLSLLMVMNFVFTDGKYNGSTITIVGQNAVTNKVREMPIVGGTGLFRFATGYVQAETIINSPGAGTDNYAVVEYNAYVIHY